MQKVCFSTMSSELLEIMKVVFMLEFGTYKTEVLEIIVYFSLIFLRVTGQQIISDFLH